MKKAYAKPVLYAESFELVEHISATCAYRINFGVTCAYEEDDTTFFTVDPCSSDAISMISNAFPGTEDLTSLSMEQIINKLNVQCYNSFGDLNMLYIS